MVTATADNGALGSDPNGDLDVPSIYPVQRVGRKRKLVMDSAQSDGAFIKSEPVPLCSDKHQVASNVFVKNEPKYENIKGEAQDGSSVDEGNAADASSAASEAFRCDLEGCTKVFRNEEQAINHVLHKKEHLVRHMRATHEANEHSKQFSCTLCHAAFTYKHALVRHMHRSHTNINKPYQCDVCLLAFKKKSELQAHSYVHTGIYPFPCNECDERFLKRYHLVRHQRRHESAKASQVQVRFCEVDGCEEMFFSKTEEKQHMQEVHGGDDQTHGDGKDAPQLHHVCKVCDRSFPRKQNLRAHLRTHFEPLDDRKLIVCPMPGCDKQYTKRTNMMAHYNAVHDPVKSQRFACPYEGCAGKFGYKKVLAAHIDKIHVNPSPASAKRRRTASPSTKTRLLGENQTATNAPTALFTLPHEQKATSVVPYQEEERETSSSEAVTSWIV
ncbi:TPA: hypothetical protein N0F65_001627 [Lagenidium giganteum]|uniref:C2H2-type domain-containing protein n=1 Tax=Lagenidium giganteum TaxID=4803 RepID=A0AAV2YJB6_9STRA|nr:TPA: hypothetical protein N0F65_001627 [Lagenidium giganteum]